jgi:phenylacetate-CoA ligase
MVETLQETLAGWLLLRELRSNVRRSREALDRIRGPLLQAAVAHAWQHVPFYRRVWKDAGFDGTCRGLNDLERVPIVTRDMVRAGAESGELLARGVRQQACTHLDTSGSSGYALRIWKRPLEERLRRAVGLRIWFELGFRWRHVTVQFQGRPGTHHFLQRAGVGRKTWIDLRHPHDRQLRDFVAARADVVVANATVLRRICRDAESAGLALHRPRLVLSAGELVDADTRDLTRRILGVEPNSIYAQTEVGYLAWQCERREAFHHNADTHLIEIRRGGRAAEAGEVGTLVITDLRSRTMPILRYDTGDLAVAAGGPRPCGRGLPTLASIEGRAASALLAADRRVVTPRALLDWMAGTLRVGEYRVVQTTPAIVRLELIQGAHGDAETAVQRLHGLLGEVSISVERLPPWPLPASGKTQTSVGSIAPPEIGAS